MGWYGDYGDYGDYGSWAPRVPVATRIALGHAAAKKRAKQEGRAPCPVAIEGRTIAKTFWGLKWCENLERYQDISNRLPRGATYVRNGSVADLVIEPGIVRAIVGGSSAYTVEIKIKTLDPKVWKAIGRDCAREIDSLFDLMQGRFNDGVMQRLTQAEGGLFPTKSEISMRCSCPDSARVCKHVAATFYGVAARLDTNPELLFKLRKVDHLELIGQATSAANLESALGGAGDATLAGADLGSIFGIELDTPGDTPTKRSKVTPVQSTPASRIAKTDIKADPKTVAKIKAIARAKADAKSSAKTSAKTTTTNTASKTAPGKTARKSRGASASAAASAKSTNGRGATTTMAKPSKKKRASVGRP